MKVLKQWPSEKIRLIAGTTIPYENWIQAWIVTNITKRKDVKKFQKKIAIAKQGTINSYLTADVPDERDLESVKERTKQTMILKGALDERDLEDEV
jgi:isopentenyl diphosphate isomerase/L-lactate dehydrogenase-like FMN-dependent dehydrogenase